MDMKRIYVTTQIHSNSNQREKKRKSSQRFTARSWESGSLNQSGYINAVKKDSVFTDDKGNPVLGLLSTNKDLGGLLYSGTVYTLFKKSSMAGTKLASFEYEIFGKVQGK